ncbi:hypothetical protein PX554_08370 [Sphingomonas sp. H39-1-10]|nr:MULTISPECIES: hypothetical protein [Sphingomonas]MDF0488144.1 hypothetical protein [Sphingomonas pollutisoli]SDA33705.1 hypothetical protein SAMN03159340_02949 [Sphingomonas sp. NFR15]
MLSAAFVLSVSKHVTAARHEMRVGMPDAILPPATARKRPA